MTQDKIQEEIIEEFSMFDDWLDKYDYIISLSESLPAIDPAKRTDKYLIEGCQSREPKEIKKYDIVLHQRTNGQYILHRVIKKRGNVLTIAGDFETEKEYPVYENQVVAKVVSFCRNGKEYKVTDFIIWLYARLWVFIFPQRQNVLYLLNVIRRKLHV